MLVSFKGDEEKLIDSVISVLDAGREKFTFQEMNIISELQHKGIIINLDRREVIRNGKKVGMTYTEFEILQLLAKNPGRVLSKEQIYDVVWKESYSGDYNIVMSHISHLRFCYLLRFYMKYIPHQKSGMKAAGNEQRNFAV